MAETTTSTTISRRSTRLFIEKQNAAEAGTAGQMELRESRNASEEKEQERPQKPQKSQKRASPPNGTEGPIMPMVDFGMDLSGLFPSALEDRKDQSTPCPARCDKSPTDTFTVTKSLQASKADKGRGEGRPINFGTVLPDAIYRSSFPMIEDFHFLETLGLKTVM